MGLLDNIKGLGKKKKETTVNVPQPNAPIESTIDTQQSQGMDSKFIDGVNQRIGAVENEISKLNVSMETAKRNISEIKDDLESLKENVKMVVSLYEMVSKKFNPFMDITPEEIKEVTDELRDNIRSLELLVQYAMGDLRELYGTPDIDDVLSDLEHQEDVNDQ